eukprot:CAMPEP_0201531374 /NCGR_PEP_ID=MMETSP0161_2-20130828/47439_1 /ASSEMBLY_ACC=CAM_ASM_000251 /TAXON_ID=180227 /ORGANISM="Neoparamoeba aestuarina, Strain SoJaBio B1-5/56/2" /LENGTH=365 /DNA_ID=CAMNT_0047934255 /DNA_START=126 /DNA_END=1223 /DNA_ORIENTATION=+
MSKTEQSSPTTQPQSRSRPWFLPSDSLVAGVMSGVGSNIIIYPMDLIKSRYQVTALFRGGVDKQRLTNLPVYRNFFHACSTIVRTEGFPALYQGVVPSLVGNGLAWGSYFYLYTSAKSVLKEQVLRRHHHEDRASAALIHLSSGFFAGFGSLVLTNPVWIVKIRMQVHHSEKGVSGGGGGAGGVKYRGLIHGMSCLLREEGWRGWFRGMVPGIWATSHGAVHFMAYEEVTYHMKRNETLHSWTSPPFLKIIAKDKPTPEKKPGEEEGDLELDSGHFMVAGALSKGFAVLATYPLQVARARLQLKVDPGKDAYRSATDVALRVWREEGIRGFYRGVLVNICRVAPSGAITFLIYENTIKLLARLHG